MMDVRSYRVRAKLRFCQRDAQLSRAYVQRNTDDVEPQYQPENYLPPATGLTVTGPIYLLPHSTQCPYIFH